MSSFEWNGATVYIKPATGRTRNRYFYLKDVAGTYDMDEGMEQSDIETAMAFLSRLDHVEGDIGFPIPNGDATQEALLQFTDDLLDRDEQLFLLWNTALHRARVGGNAPDLKPPDDVPADKKKPQKSGGKSSNDKPQNG